jgi:phosphoglycerate dehydrogenase-like enzyme
MLLGMKVIATEPFPNAAFIRANPIELVDFDTLLARSDFVSIHSPLNDETRGLFNARVFARMKPGAVLINTARGGLVVEKDLIPALNSGHLGGAGLDVFEQEPPSPDNPLFRMDNVVVSPHWAGTDSQSMADMAVECAECIVKLRRGEWPEGAVVNDELRGTFKW